MKFIKTFGLTLFTLCVCAQEALITNIQGRKTQSLNGTWQYIVDPYETGYYTYRFTQRNENDREAYWSRGIPSDKTDRLEHGYISKYTLQVPGDWNSQDPKFFYYEGTIWYQKSFNYQKSNASNKVFLHFGAVNYAAEVFLNGKKLGSHKGGFTAFNFELPDSVLKTNDNFLVVKVDNKRYRDEIPTINTDWWNYGGITRDVNLVEVPNTYIQDYSFQLQKDGTIQGFVKLNRPSDENITIEIPELKFKRVYNSNEIQNLKSKIQNLIRWSPENPKLYKVIITSATDRIEEKIGFRTIETKGKQLLLNGKPLFMRGICIHEEIPQEIRRAKSKADALQLLSWAKELNCNMVRLAHYPHNENMTRVADSLGILVWSEIPVYWTVDFTSKTVLEKAKVQLNEMISRDKNRTSIIIWSVGNETPVSDARTEFMKTLALLTKQIDSTRLVSAALEVHYNPGDWDKHIVNDPLGKYVDLVAVNEYKGWYGGLPTNCRTMSWDVQFDKPFFISETGAEALGGFYGDTLTRWSEEYQEWYYKEQTNMMRKIGYGFVGASPWLLADFKSPKRNNPVYQEGWNNKGVVDQKGRKKKAFYVLKKYFDEMSNLKR
ncbi:MAG: glycoside hydrolase family 2 TIM barrel-domain containing protein [Bacteroidota bacterium]|nr:glycoside hydrolase family 2 TIM barrel-domain containing protein [Bacteroidota bacterium]